MALSSLYGLGGMVAQRKKYGPLWPTLNVPLGKTAAESLGTDHLIIGGEPPGYNEAFQGILQKQQEGYDTLRTSIENDPTYGLVSPEMVGQEASARAAMDNLPQAPHRAFQPYTPPPTPERPYRPSPRVSGPAAMLAGIGSLIAPQAAGQFGASLIEGANQQSNKEYQDALARHSEDLQERDDAIKFALENLRGKEQTDAMNAIADYDNAVKRGNLQAQIAGPEAAQKYMSSTYGPAMRAKALGEAKLGLIQQQVGSMGQNLQAITQGYGDVQKEAGAIQRAQIPAMYRSDDVRSRLIQQKQHQIDQETDRNKRAVLRSELQSLMAFGSDSPLPMPDVNSLQTPGYGSPMPVPGGIQPVQPGMLPGIPGLGYTPRTGGFPNLGVKPLPGTVTNSAKALTDKRNNFDQREQDFQQREKRIQDTSASVGARAAALQKQSEVFKAAQQRVAIAEASLKAAGANDPNKISQRAGDTKAQGVIKGLWDEYYAAVRARDGIMAQGANVPQGPVSSTPNAKQSGSKKLIYDPVTGQFK